jgi:hypothetical protein
MKEREDILEEAELARDTQWVSQLSLYVPEIKAAYESEEVPTMEGIIELFVEKLLEKERNKDEKQLWGQVAINLP